MTTSSPKYQEPLVNENGSTSRAWWRFWLLLDERTGGSDGPLCFSWHWPKQAFEASNGGVVRRILRAGKRAVDSFHCQFQQSSKLLPVDISLHHLTGCPPHPRRYVLVTRQLLYRRHRLTTHATAHPELRTVVSEGARASEAVLPIA